MVWLFPTILFECLDIPSRELCSFYTTSSHMYQGRGIILGFIIDLLCGSCSLVSSIVVHHNHCVNNDSCSHFTRTIKISLLKPKPYISKLCRARHIGFGCCHVHWLVFCMSCCHTKSAQLTLFTKLTCSCVVQLRNSRAKVATRCSPNYISSIQHNNLSFINMFCDFPK